MAPQRNIIDRRLSVAPMMDWTDRHCRFFHRLLAPNALLYTEMVTTGALLHGDVARHLDFDHSEHPVALQLGGSEPEALAQCAGIGEERGYDEINLNCGCPSDRVQKGRFGACLMAEPDLVAGCVAAMRHSVAIPVTVKCRIGIDEMDPETCLYNFVGKIAAAGCRDVIVHARKAWLEGLSPKENRDIPPLDYELVARLKADFPDLSITLNGGITDVDAALAHLERFDGVMLGRAAYHNPDILPALDQAIFGSTPKTLEEIVAAMIVYADEQLAANPHLTLHAITKHMLGLNAGQRGARSWRRILTVDSLKSRDAAQVLGAALEAVSSPENAAA